MEDVVNCRHCQYYAWFSASDDNLTAVCDVKGIIVSATNTVCQEFIVGDGVHTTRNIPEYCRHYHK